MVEGLSADIPSTMLTSPGAKILRTPLLIYAFDSFFVCMLKSTRIT